MNKIVTDNFIIKKASVDNANALLAYRLDNKEVFKPTEPHRHESYYTLEMVKIYLKTLEHSMADKRSVNFIIWDKTETKILGVINFSQIVPHPFNACYLGYSLHHSVWGQGIMGRALSLCIDEMFNDFKLHRIMANYLPENARSAKVLEKLGFIKEGFAKNYLEINGKWCDHILTSLTNDNLLPI